MATFVRVNEYRRGKVAGEEAVRPTGHGMRLRPDKVTYIYWAGISSDDHNVFTVYLQDGRSFITDWSGVQDISSNATIVRINEYARTEQEDGTVRLQDTGHGIRVNPIAVVKVYTAGLGLEQNGVDTHECFTFHLTDSRRFVSDWAGWQLVSGAGV